MKHLALTFLLAATGCIADSRIPSNVPVPSDYMRDIRVTNGTVVPKGGAPFLVKLLLKRNGGYGLCGGTIIDPTTIITAGHCVFISTDSIVSPSGAYVYYGSESSSNTDYVQATQITLHESYDSRRIKNDIAILRIPPLTLVPGKVEAISFYDDKVVPKQALQIYGWGNTRTGGGSNSNPPSLLTQTVYISQPKDCQVIEPSYVSADGPQICVDSHYSIGVDVCQGDSGTGATIINNGTQYYSGLVSYGTNARGESTCGEDGSFGMYTNVYYYKSWIESVTGNKYPAGPPNDASNAAPVPTVVASPVTTPTKPPRTCYFLIFCF
ncbi:Transmembrane protease serine 11F [Coemansia sp. S16]|nr:Transmembrane protease serine 11F [Coemansia sp. S3946]KAJ2044950.1 Transmembrane protease serine 11F [Coemansia sp. S16]KAJ2068584.1 Transmembrane protease serine 11F [Coemansia sp. S155-1]KAJ2085165.1 Transmembrane protease serine 11F [Coemansia sp. S142-1]KAJ2095811.1 Transmembrane protease serine 11F [Coemansia sp. S100]